ncbi:MAG TPA: hypothetical protein DEQ02_00180 [Ruminococcaceae bacterium]|nr:hypothetical protein [Oscillospiraceae bacterium]
MHHHDDHDVKIFDGLTRHNAKPVSSFDVSDIERELEAARESGKTDIARRLGRQLAMSLHEQKGLHRFGADDCDESTVGIQRKLLLAFCIDNCIDQAGLGSVLEGIVINSFYENLSRLDPALYNDIRQSGALSFYFLAGRRGGDSERHIANTFAMLCGYDGNHIFEEYGEALYSKFTATVAAKIKNTGL